MKETREQIQAKAAELLDKIEEMKSTKDFGKSQENRMAFASMIDELEKLGDEIRLDKADDQIARWTATPEPQCGRTPVDDGDYRAATSWRNDRDENPKMSYRTANDKKDYRSIFGNPGKDWHHRDMSFFEALFSGRAHPGLNELRAMGENTPSLGGFLVPSETSEMVHNIAVGSELVLPRANVIRMNGASIEVPAFEVSNMSSSLFGGFTASWTAEAGTMSNANPTVRSMTFSAKKLTGFVRISNELYEDVGRRSNDLLNVIGQGLGWYRDKYLLTGDGVGKPLGIKESPCAIQVSKEGGQAADTIVYENLAKALSRMHPAGVDRCVWVAHPSCLPALLTLSISIGTSGSHFPILTSQSGKYELLTRPLILSEHMSPLGDAFDIALIDFSQYCVAMRSDMRMDFSQHTYFTTDEMAIRLISRFDGQCLWDKAMTLPDGSTTVSPVVYIEAR